MREFTKQQLNDALQKLPSEVQEIVLSTERSDMLHGIMQRHELTVAEIKGVIDALAPVSFGLVHPEKFPERIRQALPTTDAAKISALIVDLNESMLAPIRSRVMQLAHQQKSPAEIPEQPTPSTPTGATPDPTQAKLEGTHRLAPDTVTVTEKKKVPPPPKKGGYPTGADPYREPIG